MNTATIFITSFHGLISRNILSTPLLGLLSKNGFRVVLLVPDYKKDFFEKEFGDADSIVIGIKAALTRRELRLRSLSFALLHNATMKIKRKTEMRGSGAWLAPILGERKIFRIILRALSLIFTPRQPFGELIAKYQPAIIFSTDSQNELDVRLVYAARSKKIPVVSMVRSWDNLTSKGVLRFCPDRLVVWNEIMRDEALRYVDLPKEAVSVVGIPHYDNYVKGERNSKNQFFSSVGLDPAKPFVLFIPTGDRYIVQNTIDKEILELLDDLVPQTHQILVRLPPADTVNLEGIKVSRRVHIEEPGVHFGKSKKTMELSAEDDKHIADILSACSLVVVGPSTMAIDAAVFDKPTIFIAFEGKHVRPYYEGMKRFANYIHIRHIIDAGGVRVVESKDELKKWIDAYLKDPLLDREGRQRLVERECFRLDGHSTERLADVLITAARL